MRNAIVAAIIAGVLSACGGRASEDEQDSQDAAATTPAGCIAAVRTDGYRPGATQWKDIGGQLWECPSTTVSVCADPDGAPWCCGQSKCSEVRWR